MLYEEGRAGSLSGVRVGLGPGVGPKVWHMWLLYPLGAVCRGHAQSSAFAPSSSELASDFFLSFSIFLSIICPSCPGTQLFFICLFVSVLAILVDLSWYLIVVLIWILPLMRLAIFYLLICHLYVIFDEVIVHIFCPYILFFLTFNFILENGYFQCCVSFRCTAKRFTYACT